MHCCAEPYWSRLARFLARYGLRLEFVPSGSAIPGSYWGEPEAGIVGHTVYARADTPVHSVLHEAGHIVCMDAARRASLHSDAGGEYAEEDAVCYLQIVLAGRVGLSVAEICRDMDAWGYTFRLGSACDWYLRDADDARAWLTRHQLLTDCGEPTFRLRAA
jgi:hypothetical protein